MLRTYRVLVVSWERELFGNIEFMLREEIRRKKWGIKYSQADKVCSKTDRFKPDIFIVSTDLGFRSPNEVIGEIQKLSGAPIIIADAGAPQERDEAKACVKRQIVLEPTFSKENLLAALNAVKKQTAPQLALVR